MENASPKARAGHGRPEDDANRRDLSTVKTIRLGQAHVDLTTWEITRQGHRSRLQEKPFRVLAALTERPGELITRAELRERLWPDGTVVDFDNNLNSAVANLRLALGDVAKAPRIIQTLPRLGYRLIAEVNLEDPASREEAPERNVEVARPRRFPPWSVAAAAGVTLVLLAAGVREGLGARVSRSPDPAGHEPVSHAKTAPDDPAARQAWQSGLYLLTRGSAGDLSLALESFEKARRLQPGFAPAHIKIAETLVRMSFGGGLTLRHGFTQAREAASRAHSLDPTSGPAYRIQALADLHLDWDFEAAGRGLESALRLDPNNAENYLATATFLSAAGRNEAAVLAARRAVALDPASSLLRADLGYFMTAAGHYAEVLTLSEELLELEPDSIHVLGSRLIAASRLGLFERALTAAQQIMELRGADATEIRNLAQDGAQTGLMRYQRWSLATFRANADPSHFRLALRQAISQQKESALASLQQAYERREPWLVYLHSDARLDDLRDDPRFLALVGKLGFPQPTDAVVTRVESLL